ncbi:L-seryl-tRNA(Sec) selenium transferase [Desulfatitalea tepidiphila]|uniref:L-seryl-tRNA(Sec) selenium transferase n=1 Tax=Desulfatitalea tepidiphila TaxID=1185843 RepID=UPI0006B5433A|nr:L-seryl-tRNA(Sec) selenium transferase [Desulfatitalea tepidiphila]
MSISEKQQELLRRLPGVDHLIHLAENDPRLQPLPKSVLVRAIRETLAELRRQILEQPATADDRWDDSFDMIARIVQKASVVQAYNLKRTVNATGVVVHTNLGRSCLAREAIDHLVQIASCYSNLEFDLKAGRRGSRYSAVEDLLCELSGAEAAMAVNNNAAAVLLCLDTMARGKEVIISRGELVEIGGSFRIPDVMARSGAILKEVGTTNRTHLRDYQQAISNDTGLLLKVHTSNYSIVGFTAAVTLEQMVTLGRQFNLPVMEDLGSGNLIDLTRYGLTAEPTVQASVAAGIDVVTFSGDKLLGGPQAGLIVGKTAFLDRIKTNPLTRALRIDKMTLAALEATLRLYRDERQAVSRIPTLRMLFARRPELEGRANRLAEGLRALPGDRLAVEPIDLSSRAGGGALPLLDLPSCGLAVRVQGLSASRIESHLRANTPPIIGRIENDRFILDPRTLRDDELQLIVDAFEHLLTHSTTTQTNSHGDH